ncbi:FUSC family protein [Pseudoxanthomonas sp.]|uniref:FUSC family protein n=1 Tax=Pseudoxanthomonas sp. TaxID=1871049 RepID=UPI00261973E6|nr:FUSC family protein [Pseudoxanthomonas sp.]WDS38046.1 MAG: FUSC family protein [Pseudoxanthomonas sp.]
MLRTLLRLKPRDVPVRVALRNSFAVFAPLALGVWLGAPAIGLGVATGALQTMSSDQPGAYGLRMRRMLLTAAIAGTSGGLGVLLGDYTAPLTLAVLAVGFCGGLAVALGPLATRNGLASMILLMICANMHLGAAQAPGIALLIFSGGLLQMLMAVAAWPLQRYRPERFALATILQQLAITARTRPDASQPSPTMQAAQDALVLLHGQHHTRGVALQSFRIMAELCERVRVDLLALADVHARLDDAGAGERIELLLKQAALVLDHLSQSMREPAAPTAAEGGLVAVQTQAVALREAAAAATGLRDRRLLQLAVGRAAGLAGQLRALVRNSYWASSQGQINAQQAEARLPRALRPNSAWVTLKANLKWSSVAFRHAVRCAVSLVVALLLERTLQIPHGVWVPMTTAIVLKPDFGATLTFGAGRMAGTLAGLVAGTALIHYAMDGSVVRLLLFWVFCFGFRLTTQVNYGLAVMLLTSMVVLMLSFEGYAPETALLDRVLATLIGSAVAMVAYALWPTWEGSRGRGTVAALLEADQRHLSALLAGRVDVLDETRGTARVARTNVRASIDRLRAEPRRKGNRGEAELAESLLANATRLMRAPLILEAQLREGGHLPARPELTSFSAAVDQTLGAQVRYLRQTGKFSEIPALRPYERRLAEAIPHTDDVSAALLDAADRIADSLDTLTHLLRRSSTPGNRTAATVTGTVAG